MYEGTDKNSKQSKSAVEKQEANVRFNPGTGNVGFATPGLSQAAPVPISTTTLAAAGKKNPKRSDRYAQDGKLDDINSEIAEENLGYLITSPAPKSPALESILETKKGEKKRSSQGKQRQNKDKFSESVKSPASPETPGKLSPAFGDNRSITFEDTAKAGDGGVNSQRPKATEQPLKLQMSKISQEDIRNRNTFEEIENDDLNAFEKRKNNQSPSQDPGFNSSGLSVQDRVPAVEQLIENRDTSIHKKEHSIAADGGSNQQAAPLKTTAPAGTVAEAAARAAGVAAQKAANENVDMPQARSPRKATGLGEGEKPRANQKKDPDADPLAMETARLQKLENLKEYVQFKKVVEYESETIELYEMMSQEFDYDELRKESPNFNIKQYKDSIYRGEINKKRKRHGKGVIVYDAGRIYEGDWAKDKREGRGFELFSNGNTYQGEYQNGKAHGKGAYTWRNGEVYDGEWLGGQKCGYGVWRGIHGDSYIGQWKDSKAEGYGVHTWVDGDRYEGEWKECLRHGNGTDFFANGDMYIGQYEDGKPSGFGQYKWANGNSYTGEFMLGQKHGKGKWRKKPANQNEKNKFNQYDGYYEMDKKHGYGQFQWESGNKYAGNYHQDERQGYGTMEWTDSSQYRGHWIRGVQHGVGIMMFPDGTKRAGFFDNNIFQLPLKSKDQIANLVNEMPEDILQELNEYLQQRQNRIDQMKEDGEDVQSQMLESEQNYMGQEFKPRVEYEEPSDGDNNLKMNAAKEMVEVGKQINDKMSTEPFVNHEGLRRVYRAKNSKNFDDMAQNEAHQDRGQIAEAKQTIGKQRNDFQTNRMSPEANGDNSRNLLQDQNYNKDIQQTLQAFRPDSRQEADYAQASSFAPRKRSVTKNTEVQTELKMGTITRYEQSIRVQQQSIGTAAGGSSSTNNQNATNDASNYHKDYEFDRSKHRPNQSDFSQMFRASKEFPSISKKRTNVLDQSMAFTDVDLRDTRKEKIRQIEQQRGEIRDKYISDDDPGSTVLPAGPGSRKQGHNVERHHRRADQKSERVTSNMTQNTTDVGVQKYIKVHNKMIQTTQNTKNHGNKFLLNPNDMNTSFDGSDVLPAEAMKPQRPKKAHQKAKERTKEKHTNRRQNNSWFDNKHQEEQQSEIESGQEYDEAEIQVQKKQKQKHRKQKGLRKPSRQESQESEQSELSQQSGEQRYESIQRQQVVSMQTKGVQTKQKLFKRHARGTSMERAMQVDERSSPREESDQREYERHKKVKMQKFFRKRQESRQRQIESDVQSSSSASKLPLIDDRQRPRKYDRGEIEEAQRSTSGFRKLFNKAYNQSQNKQKRSKFMEHYQEQEYSGDDQSIDEDAPLKFNDFEIRPLARDTQHLPAPRMHPDLTLASGQYNQSNFNYFTDGHSPQNTIQQHSALDYVQHSPSQAAQPTLTLQPSQSSQGIHGIMPAIAQQQTSPFNQVNSVNQAVENAQNLPVNQVLEYQAQPTIHNAQQRGNSKGVGNLKKKKKKAGVNRGAVPRFGSNNDGNQNPIRIGDDTKRPGGGNAGGSVGPVRAPIGGGIRILPQSFGNGNLKGIHSTSNKMAQIYKQPITNARQAKSTKNHPHNANAIINSMNNQSISTTEQSAINPARFQAQAQSLNSGVNIGGVNAQMALGMLSDSQPEYLSGPGTQLDTQSSPQQTVGPQQQPTVAGSLPVNSVGLGTLKKRKSPPLANPAAPHANQTDSPKSPKSTLPQIMPQSLNYHQNNNSIQAIDVHNSSGHNELADINLNLNNSNVSFNDSPERNEYENGKVMATFGGKKSKRKRVWVPASSFRRIGMGSTQIQDN